MSDLPKFLIFRFAPGASGNFVSSMLQCSPEVAHLDPHEQKNKPHNNWLRYFAKVFRNDLANWTHYEPSSVYNWGTKNIFSQKFNRGNTIGTQEFLELEKKHCSKHYQYAKSKNLYIPIFWHKNYMPQYFANSVSVTIDINNKFAQRWFNRARYRKHYNLSQQNGKIVADIMENRPNYQVSGFNNPTTKQFDSLRQFVQHEIIDDPFRINFTGCQNVQRWTIPNININLSSILSDSFINDYHRICDFYDLTPLRDTIITMQLHQQWLDCHE